MNTSSEAAEQIVRLSLEGFEVAAKISGAGAKNVAILLYAVLKDRRKTAGKTNLINMLKSGKELKVFSIKSDEFQKFTQEAKRYGVLYSALINKKEKNSDGVVDIMVRAEDASKINRIVERFKLAGYDEVSIRNEIAKSRNEKSNKDVIDNNKENKILNPHLAKTEKSPLSEPLLETQKTSVQGSSINKTSVRKKLDEAKKIVNARDVELKKLDNIKSNIHKHIKKRKNKESRL